MRSRFRLVGGLLIGLGACAGDGPVTQTNTGHQVSLSRVRDCQGPATSLAPALAAALPPRTGAMMPDDQWADLAARVPGGFAGVIYDNGQPVLFLTDPSQAAAAKQALASALSPFDVAHAAVRQARWDFAQLVDWYNYLAGQTPLWRTDGITMGDKDESRNRIHYGVKDEAARARLLGVLAGLDLPCDLIFIDMVPPAVALDQMPAAMAR